MEQLGGFRPSGKEKTVWKLHKIFDGLKQAGLS